MIKNVRFIISGLFCICFSHAVAQHTLSGHIVDKESGHAVEGAQVIVSTNGDINTFAITNKEGMYQARNLLSGIYTVEVSCIGYDEYEKSVKIDRETTLDIELKEKATLLDSVVVEGKRPRATTATGHVYYLSKKAVESGDPYLALKEIPELISNEVSQSVQSKDGMPLLVLIDGMQINTGITPIDPKRIESVEVMDVVTAKYMRTGAKRILNIRLKPQKEIYQFYQIYLHDKYPIYSNIASVASEIGNDKFSLYYSIDAGSSNDKRSSANGWTETDAYRKTSAVNNTSWGKSISYDFMLKYKPTIKDYFAAYFQGYNTSGKSDSNGWGYFEQFNGSKGNFASDHHSKTFSRIFSGSFFFRHKFNNTMTIETTARGSYNYNNQRNSNNDHYPTYDWIVLREFRTSRSIGSLSTDYEWSINSNYGFNAGHSLSYTDDKLSEEYGLMPLYRHREWNEYVYAGFNGKVGNLRYQASLGVDGIWRWSAGVFYRYASLRDVISLSYDMRKYGSMALAYNSNSAPPSIEKLNPFNTSSDSLYQSVGNPYLRPQTTHGIAFLYSVPVGRFYFSLKADYTAIIRRYESIGVANDKGVYTTTYANLGHYHNASVSGTMIYTTNKTQVNINGCYFVDYFAGQSSKPSMILNAYVWQRIGERFSTNQSVDYTNKEFYPQSVTRFRYVSSSFFLNYNLSKTVHLALGAESIFGNPRQKTLTFAEGYKGYSFSKQQLFHPYITFRWTLYKNRKKKMDLNNDIMKERDDEIKL